jgi:hypothetical protein
MCGFTSRSRIYHLFGDVTIASEVLQNLGLCTAHRALEQGGSLSCHTCCNTGPQFFRSHPKDRRIYSPLTTHKGMCGIYSYPDSHKSPFSRLSSPVTNRNILFVCLRFFTILNNFSVIWWWSVFIGARENQDTICNVFGVRPPTFRM